MKCFSRALGALPLSVWLVAAAAGRASAEEPATYEPTEFMRERPALPESLAHPTPRRLSVREAVQLAVQNNLGVELSRQQLAIQRQGIPFARGRFEPTVTALFRHSDSASPPSTLQEGMPGQVLDVETNELNLGYRQQLSLGTTLGLDFGNSRSRSNLGSAVGPLLHTSVLNLRLVQPLLRGFAFDLEVPYADVLRAELSSEAARQAVVGVVMSTVRQAELEYWDLVFALKSHQVQQRSLELAREQVSLTERQIEAGIRPPSDLINAEGTLAQRELRLLQAENAILGVADQLRHLLNMPRGEWAVPLLPVDAPELRVVSVTLEGAYARALANRPELAQGRLAVNRAELDARVAENERLPRLDAELTYGLIGQNPSYGDTLSQLSSGDARTYSGALSFSWEPLNRAASARLETFRLTELAERTALEQRELDLQLELRAALRALDTALRSVSAAAKVRQLAERSLDAEQRLFQTGSGTSNSFFIAQRQDALAQAELDELSALIQHERARTALSAAMGVLLEERGIELGVRGAAFNPRAGSAPRRAAP